jgi:predicted acylesterase/phospholipase RssA
MPQRYLLSIDGGGIRGILPATALVKLEQITGKRTREIFSFAAGTSTGALLSAAIAAGVPATRILDIYLRRGPEIFTPRAPWNTIKRVATGSMYSTQTLYNVLAEELGAASGWKLNDSPIDLLLTAKGLDGKPWYFVRDNPKNSGVTGRLGLADCATASAAAPTYFKPWVIREGPGTLVDGGVGVTGNPVYQACVEAFFYTPGYTPQETTVVSLGTGRFVSDQNPRGLWGWLQWILGELLRSPGEQQTELVYRHFPDMIFHRLDADIQALDPSLKEAIDMDDVEAIDRLHRYGEQFAALIDWPAILAGTDTTFRVGKKKTQWYQYKAS